LNFPSICHQLELLRDVSHPVMIFSSFYCFLAHILSTAVPISKISWVPNLLYFGIFTKSGHLTRENGQGRGKSCPLNLCA
jgi:hypothetical protein